MQDEPEDDEVHETDSAAFLGTSGEDPEADDALAKALQLDAVATVAWQRFSGKGKGKSKGKGRFAAATGARVSEAKHPVSTSPCSAATRLQMPQPWSPTHASMPVTSPRQVRDDRRNHRVSFPHRLHRYLSAQ